MLPLKARDGGGGRVGKVSCTSCTVGDGLVVSGWLRLGLRMCLAGTPMRALDGVVCKLCKVAGEGLATVWVTVEWDGMSVPASCPSPMNPMNPLHRPTDQVREVWEGQGLGMFGVLLGCLGCFGALGSLSSFGQSMSRAPHEKRRYDMVPGAKHDTGSVDSK